MRLISVHSALRKCSLLLLPGALALPASAGIDHWTPVGPPGGVIIGLAHSPLSPRAFHAFNDTAIFTSLDRGATWQRTDGGLAGYQIRTVAVAPISPSVLYAIVINPALQTELFRTENRGDVWHPVPGTQGLLDDGAPLVVAPRTSVLYSRIRGRFARSLDGGVQWEIGGQGFPATGSVVDIEANSAVEGVVWVLLRNAPGRPILRSLDGGETWSRASGGLPNELLVDLTTGDPHQDVAFATTGRHVFRTNDGGQSWVRLGQTPSPEPIRSIAFDGIHSGFLYAIAERHLLKSIDGGRLWQVLDGPGNPELPQDILIDPSVAGTLRVATAGGGVLTSVDFGETWQPAERFEAAEVSSFALDPSTPGTVYAKTGYSSPFTSLSPRYDDLLQSRDDGRSWLGLRAGELGPLGPLTSALAIARQPPFTVYAGIEGGVAISTDGGRSWQARRSFCGSPFRLLVAPSNPLVLYAEAGLLDVGECLGADPSFCAAPRSLDGGETWQCLDQPILAIAPNDHRVLYRQRPFGPLERSTDDGAAWSSVDFPDAGASVSALAISVADPTRLYLATPARVFSSHDGGASWTLAAPFPVAAGLIDVEVDPHDPDRVYVLQSFFAPAPSTVQTHFVWASEDGGASWRSLSAGLPAGGARFTGLAVDATQPSTLYLSVSGWGLFRYTFSRPGTCAADATTLCLENNRFRVRAHWRDFQGRMGVARAHPLTGDTGAFWFFRPENLELVTKIVDGTGLNDRFWFFEASLSNVGYTLEVLDTETGLVQRYFNPSGRFASLGDTGTFLDPASSLQAAPLPTGSASLGKDPSVSNGFAEPCLPKAISLCLQARFRVEVRWRDFAGRTGVGVPVFITGDTGAFWFFDDANLELITKVVDGTGLNGHFWFFHGGLSNVEYTITVRDEMTQRMKTYTNPAGTFASAGDTGAFPE